MGGSAPNEDQTRRFCLFGVFSHHFGRPQNSFKKTTSGIVEWCYWMRFAQKPKELGQWLRSQRQNSSLMRFWCASKSGSYHQMAVVPWFLSLFGWSKVVDVGFQGQEIHWCNCFDRISLGNGLIVFFGKSKQPALISQRNQSHYHISESAKFIPIILGPIIPICSQIHRFILL
jgi:hypothetical protein